MSTTPYVKQNNTGFPDALRCEARGLSLLREALSGCALQVPEVYGVDDGALEMTAIATGRWDETAWRDLGEGLAALHRAPHPAFGLEEDNYIGLNPQKNRFSDRWGRFFVDYRLAYQVSLIAEGELRRSFQRLLDRHGDKLAAYLDRHCDHPSLVHGDLWSGNALCDSEGRPWLIDPAVYFGDREVDVAMTEMFGGFSVDFYRAYENLLPLSPAYGTKSAIYNLYHYLNHYNLFGGGYLAGCRRGFDIIADL